MSYHFTTGLIEPFRKIGYSLSVQDLLLHHSAAEQNDIITWIGTHAPDTHMFVRKVTVEEEVQRGPNSKFSNIHPDIDGLTVYDVICKDVYNSNRLSVLHKQQMIAQMKTLQKMNNVTIQWVAKMDDRASVEYKLYFPDATALDVRNTF